MQLVCKYLWALNEEEINPGKGIDKLFKFYCKKWLKIQVVQFIFLADPIKFGDKRDLEVTVCLELLKQYMPDLMKERKISQRLFIK